jgi:hypothetical protein
MRGEVAISHDSSAQAKISKALTLRTRDRHLDGDLAPALPTRREKGPPTTTFTTRVVAW